MFVRECVTTEIKEENEEEEDPLGFVHQRRLRIYLKEFIYFLYFEKNYCLNSRKSRKKVFVFLICTNILMDQRKTVYGLRILYLRKLLI